MNSQLIVPGPKRGPIRSLFIISLPRSLSTLINYHCRVALQLRSPGWADAGEVLNPDRILVSSGRLGNEAVKFTPPEQVLRFARLSEFLGDVINLHDCVYKDVVQPFVVSQWLCRNNLAVLRIRRPVAEVAWAMLKRGWSYPRNAAPSDRPETYRLISGLVRAAEALDTTTGEHLDFDDLINSEDVLRSALQRLYPELKIPSINYIDREFRDHTQALSSERFETPDWPAFQQEVTDLINSMTAK